MRFDWSGVDRARSPDVDRDIAAAVWPLKCREMEKMGLSPEMVDRVVITAEGCAELILSPELFGAVVHVTARAAPRDGGGHGGA